MWCYKQEITRQTSWPHPATPQLRMDLTELDREDMITFASFTLTISLSIRIAVNCNIIKDSHSNTFVGFYQEIQWKLTITYQYTQKTREISSSFLSLSWAIYPEARRGGILTTVISLILLISSTSDYRSRWRGQLSKTWARTGQDRARAHKLALHCWLKFPEEAPELSVVINVFGRRRKTCPELS